MYKINFFRYLSLPNHINLMANKTLYVLKHLSHNKSLIKKIKK